MVTGASAGPFVMAGLMVSGAPVCADAPRAHKQRLTATVMASRMSVGPPFVAERV